MIVLSALVLVIVVLGLAQLVLPGIAASTLRSRLDRSGRVLSVRVSAFPAVELLWHHASSISVRMASYRASSTRQLESLLDEAGGVGRLTASAERLDTGLVTLTDASLLKRGSRLVGHADLSEASLRQAIPPVHSLTYARSESGTLTLQGTASVFGVSLTVPVTVHAVNGRLVATGHISLFSVSVTVYSDPHVYVDGVSGSATPSGLALSATGTYR